MIHLTVMMGKRSRWCVLTVTSQTPPGRVRTQKELTVRTSPWGSRKAKQPELTENPSPASADAGGAWTLRQCCAYADWIWAQGIQRDYVFCTLCVFTHINISVNTRALL